MSFSKADITNFQQALEEVHDFKSEISATEVYDKISKMSDEVRDLPSNFQSQLDCMSRMVKLLSDTAFDNYMNVDGRLLADLLSQALLALKLISTDPSITNLTLVFTCCLTKLKLPKDILLKCIRFIKGSIEVMVASIKTLGYKSEASLKNIIDVMTNICGEVGEILEDKVIDIVCHFIAKLIAFWTTISGGFAEDDFKLSHMPEVVSKVRKVLSEGNDIIETFLGVYEWITDNFPRFIKGDFSGMFFGKAETSAFETRVSRIKKMYPLVTSGSLSILKEEYNHTLSSYDSEISELIKNADRMMKKAKDAQKPSLKRMSDELREIQTDRMLKQAQIQTKMSAFGVCFVGGSGVGKSLLMEQTARTLIQAAGEVPSSDKIVSGQMSDKFDSNELPHHLVLMYDDVANNSNNENYDKLLNAVNAQSRPFLKAAVEEKGIMFPGNIGCVISTNVPGYNARKSNCPDSLGRRFLHIEVQIKPSILDEICVPGTRRIDPILASSNGTRMDIWMFNVFEFVTFDEIPEDQKPPDVERWEGMYVRRVKWTDKDIKDQTFWDLALYLKDKAQTHYVSQKKLLDKIIAGQQEDFCKECCIPCSVCACNVQSEFITDSYDQGIDRLIEKYNQFCAWQREWWNLVIFRSILGISIAMAPIDYYKTCLGLFGSICAISLICRFSLFTTMLCIFAFTPIGIFATIFYAYNNLRKELATRVGVLTHLADESVTVFRTHRDKIFVGAGLISFAYLLYKSFRPRSQFLSYRDKIPENIRTTFARAEKARTTPIDNIMPHMKRDIGKISVENSEGKISSCLAFPIYSNFYVTVGHMIPTKGDFCVTIIHESALNPTVSKQKMSQSHVYRFPKKDLVLINIPSAVPRKGYCDYLLGREVHLGDQTVNLLSCDLDTAQRYTSLTRLTPGWSMMSSTVKTDKVVLTKPYKYDCPTGTRYGMCGSLVVDHSKAIIYGFHVAGNGKVGLCDTLTRESVNEAIKSFSGFQPVNQGELQLGSHSLEKGLGMVELCTGDASVDKSIEDHNCIIEGILPGASATFKSPYREHPYYKDVVTEFGLEKSAPPQKVNDPYHKRKALTKLTSPNQEFSLDEVEFASTDYLKEILEEIDTFTRDEKKELSRILSVQEALDGIGEKSLGGVDNSTSVGFPYKGKKMDYLERDPMDINLPLTPRELKQAYNTNIEDEMNKMIETYKLEKTCRPLFKCSMKTNELLPKNKFKARVFMGSNFPFLLVCRRYLAPYVRMVSRNRFLFESAKGINMDSIEAEELYQYLSGNEERTVALDYSAFDQTMSAQVSTAVSGCIIKVMKHLGCSEEHILVTRGILTDINYPNLHFFGTILQLANSDPSGNPITTELNGGVNSIYLRIFFFRIYEELKGKISYRQAIKTMTYGDDNINSVPIKYNKFNGTNIVAEGKKCGLTITMADKDAEVTDFTHLHESDFLKRKFRYCPDLGHIRAPLTKDSITKSLYFMKNDSPEPPEILFAQNVDGALRKISQYGREDFDDMRQKLLIIARKHDVVPLCKWWSYDELIEHDRKNYYDFYRGYGIADAEDNGASESDFISESFEESEINKDDLVCVCLLGTNFVSENRESDIIWRLRKSPKGLSAEEVRSILIASSAEQNVETVDLLHMFPVIVQAGLAFKSFFEHRQIPSVKILFKTYYGIMFAYIILQKIISWNPIEKIKRGWVIFRDKLKYKYMEKTNPCKNNFVSESHETYINWKSRDTLTGLTHSEIQEISDSINEEHKVRENETLFMLPALLQVAIAIDSFLINRKIPDVKSYLKTYKGIAYILVFLFSLCSWLPNRRLKNKLRCLNDSIILGRMIEEQEDLEEEAFYSESWEGDLAWRLRELPRGLSVDEVRDILIAASIEQAQTGHYDVLPPAFQQAPPPPTFFQKVWYQIRLVFNLIDFKSESLNDSQMASLKKYFSYTNCNNCMVVGTNFCALYHYGKLGTFMFHNNQGVKEAQPLLQLVKNTNLLYNFEAHPGFITSQECFELRKTIPECEVEFDRPVITGSYLMSLKKYFSIYGYDQPLILGVNFCAVVSYGKVTEFFFYNAEGIKEAKSFFILNDIDNVDYIFSTHSSCILAQECREIRYSLQEPEPEFRSEAMIFSKEVEEVTKDSIIEFILTDEHFVKYFISNHVDDVIYEHYLYLQQKLSEKSCLSLQRSVSGEEQNSLSLSASDTTSLTDISYEPSHSVFKSDEGFNKLPWEGIIIRSCPSSQEAKSQDLGHKYLTSKYPESKLVAREIVFNAISFDLIYELDGKFIVLETKGKGFKKCMQQAQIRCSALRKLGYPVMAAYACTDNTFRRVA